MVGRSFGHVVSVSRDQIRRLLTREYAENWPPIPGTSEKETSKAPQKGARQPSRRQDLKTAGFFGS